MRVQRILITGGGTGGHVLAGIAIADAWKKTEIQSPRVEVLFVGAKGGLEEKLVPKAGYPLELLSLGALNGVGLLRKLKTALKLPWACLRSSLLLIQFRPNYVLGVGGYASGPVVLMARVLSWLRILKCSVAVLEQNSIPGLTNRILGRMADVAFSAFPGTEKFFPRIPVIVTGNPIRSIMKPMSSAKRRPFTVFVFGGSQGAIGMNSLVLASLPYLQDIQDQLRWIHQTGEKDFERVRQGYLSSSVEAKVEKFVDQMAQRYEEASLLICRAGSSTLSEIAAVGRAAILVPFPSAADGHQEKNAEVYAQVGGAYLFRQSNGTGEALAALIRKLFENPAQLESMEKAVAKFYRPHAAEDLVKQFRQFKN